MAFGSKSAVHQRSVDLFIDLSKLHIQWAQLKSGSSRQVYIIIGVKLFFKSDYLGNKINLNRSSQTCLYFVQVMHCLTNTIIIVLMYLLATLVTTTKYKQHCRTFHTINWYSKTYQPLVVGTVSKMCKYCLLLCWDI